MVSGAMATPGVEKAQLASCATPCPSTESGYGIAWTWPGSPWIFSAHTSPYSSCVLYGETSCGHYASGQRGSGPSTASVIVTRIFRPIPITLPAWRESFSAGSPAGDSVWVSTRPADAFGVRTTAEYDASHWPRTVPHPWWVKHGSSKSTGVLSAPSSTSATAHVSTTPWRSTAVQPWVPDAWRSRSRPRSWWSVIPLAYHGRSRNATHARRAGV